MPAVGLLVLFQCVAEQFAKFPISLLNVTLLSSEALP